MCKYIRTMSRCHDINFTQHRPKGTTLPKVQSSKRSGREDSGITNQAINSQKRKKKLLKLKFINLIKQWIINFGKPLIINVLTAADNPSCPTEKRFSFINQGEG